MYLSTWPWDLNLSSSFFIPLGKSRAAYEMRQPSSVLRQSWSPSDHQHSCRRCTRHLYAVSFWMLVRLTAAAVAAANAENDVDATNDDCNRNAADPYMDRVPDSPPATAPSQPQTLARQQIGQARRQWLHSVALAAQLQSWE